jgi:diaminopimelate decarboxylase
LYKKKSYGQTFLITNGGMHHYLAASGNLGQSLVHRPFPATVLNRLNQPMEPVNIVGPLCTPLDTLGHQLLVPRAEIGDLVGVMNAGAYGYSASPLGFLSHQPPGEVIV